MHDWFIVDLPQLYVAFPSTRSFHKSNSTPTLKIGANVSQEAICVLLALGMVVPFVSNEVGTSLENFATYAACITLMNCFDMFLEFPLNLTTKHASIAEELYATPSVNSLEEEQQQQNNERVSVCQ